jgi:membrane-associated phospholipid phosphatase
MRPGPFIFISLVAIVLSATADRWVAQAVTDRDFASQVRRSIWIGPLEFSIGDLFKWPGEPETLLLVAVGAVVFTRRSPRWHAGLVIVLCGLPSLINSLLKWVVGRGRPFRLPGQLQPIAELQPFHFAPFTLGPAGKTSVPNLCFPSGHAALAFATATALSLLFPRWRWAFYAIAAINSVGRFMDASHWVSDCVAGAALGMGGALWVHRLLRGRLFTQAPTENIRLEVQS